MFLEIVFVNDFDPTLFNGLNCRVQNNTITARGTTEELNAIIQVADGILGDRTIIMRRGSNAKNEEAQT